MDRFLKKALLADYGKKILLLSGPRQVGKTTLAESLMPSYDYLNYDSLEDRRQMLLGQFDVKKDLLILDEIHKMKKWKSWLKGYYDTKRLPPTIVTGSARLNAFRKAGDSLAGRYFHYQLFPLDVKELAQQTSGAAKKPEAVLDALLELSGFPEPYLSGSRSFYRKWRQTHLDIILRQDLIELSSLRHLSEIETLIELMRERVGAVFSYSSLKEDLRSDDKTIKRWMGLLEDSYLLFKVTPYSKKIKNSLLKAPKYYFFDVPRVKDDGARFENLVALSLLKEVSYKKEVEGRDFSLHYLRNKSFQEVDFLVCEDQQPRLMIECKTSDASVAPSLRSFRSALGGKVACLQLVKTLERPYTTPDGIRVEHAAQWLQSPVFDVFA